MHRYLDFVAQVVALLLQLLGEPTVLGQRLFALALDAPALRDVAENDDCTVRFAVFHDRRAGVFDGHRAAVRVPEHLAVHAVDLSIFQCGVDRAVLDRVIRAVLVRVVVHVVGSLPANVLGFPADDLCGRRIAECYSSLGIQPVYPLTRRIQYLLLFRLQPGELFIRVRTFSLDLLALRYVAEDDDGACQFTVIEDRCAGVLDGDTGTVDVPEHLVIDMVRLAVPERRIDRAVVARIRRAVGVRMVMHLVRQFSTHVVELPAENPRCGGVAEGDPALAVQAVDTLAGRVQ